MGGILDARPRVGYFYTGEKHPWGMLVEELSSITIEDIMSVPIVVSASKSAYDAVVTMFLEDVGTSLLWMERDAFLGSFPVRIFSSVAQPRRGPT